MEKTVAKKNDYRGYEITRFGEKGALLSYQGQPVFIVGSGAEIRNDFLARLVEAYWQSTNTGTT